MHEEKYRDDVFFIYPPFYVFKTCFIVYLVLRILTNIIDVNLPELNLKILFILNIVKTNKRLNLIIKPFIVINT